MGLCVVVLPVWHTALLVRQAGPCSESIDDAGVTGLAGQSHGVIVHGVDSLVVMSPAPPTSLRRHTLDIAHLRIVPSFAV